jgi:GlpG protein
MRQIGHIENETAAHTFGDFLYVRGIENQVEHDKDHGWIIWVLDDDKLARAGQLLAEFQAEPNHPRFRVQASAAAELREEARKQAEAHAKKMKSGQQVFNPLYSYGFGPVTLLLIGGCVIVAILSKLGENLEPIYKLFFSEEFGRGIPEIMHGEVWRLFTPMFIHFGLMHIFFNMLWLRDLGSALERRHGSLFFIAQVLTIAVVSNTVQYLIAGPMFGGMSGVVYGMLGYLWMRGKHDPNFGLALHPSTVTMMMIWFVLCWTGLLGPIANWCHTAGLLVGVAWGFLAAKKSR